MHYNIGLHKSLCDTKLKAEAADIKEKMSEAAARSMSLAQEKGAGAWLTALPLQNLEYVLNREEFRDGLRLGYGWQIPGIPAYCVCGMKNTIDHTLSCKHGGHLIFRHNRVREVNAEFLREVCHDVKTEPGLYQYIAKMPFKEMMPRMLDWIYLHGGCMDHSKRLCLMSVSFTQMQQPTEIETFQASTSNMSKRRERNTCSE